MKEKDIKKLSKQIFEVVERDLRDRRGIRQEWDMVDEDIQEEIRESNEEKIKEVIQKFLKKE